MSTNVAETPYMRPELLPLRNGCLLTLIGFGLFFAFALLASNSVTKGLAFLGFYPLATLSGGCSAFGLADSVWVTIRASGRGRWWRSLLVAALGVSVAVAVPVVGVVLLGEAGSLFAYLIYLAFLPASLAFGANVALAGGVLQTPSRNRDVIALAAMGLAGAAGAPLLVQSFLRFELMFPWGSAGLLISGVGVIGDLGLLLQMPDRRPYLPLPQRPL